MVGSWLHSVLDRLDGDRRGCVSERRVPTLSSPTRPSQASDLDIFDDKPLRVPINCGTRAPWCVCFGSSPSGRWFESHDDREMIRRR